jgi:Rieske Fe-S protein
MARDEGMDTDGGRHEQPVIGRRVALAGGCTAGVCVLLAGCSRPTATPAPVAPTPQYQPPPVPVALGPAADIPVGGGTVFPARRVVVTRPASGRFAAFGAACTHEGCLVNQVSGGTINCPCHGSRFSITDGSVVHGPALQPLHRRSITLTGGQLLLNP